MADLGKCLLFYLKYPAEMERLYEADEPNLNGLANADQVLEKVLLVGEAASREAAEVLEACAHGIEEHFRGIGTIERVRGDTTRLWQIRYRVSPRRAKDRQFEIGVFVNVQRAAVVPWVWRRGGRRAEDDVVRILGRGVKASTGTLVLHAGTVALAEAKISMPERLEEPVSLEPLIAQVHQAFATLTAKDVAAIAAIENSRRES
jgi:hypothetical protein